jgi:rRNA biogenesis protein RRP5
LFIASEVPLSSLHEAFTVGKPVKVCILSVARDTGKSIASIRLASEDIIGNIINLQVGQSVSGIVSEMHDENAVLILQPEKARALISLRNIANARGTSIENLKSTLKKGDNVNDLVVVSRNVDKGILVVASRPATKAQEPKQIRLNIRDVSVGSQVEGRVTKHINQAAIMKFTGHLSGMVHLTDVNDDFLLTSLPPLNSIVKAYVLEVDGNRKRLTLSTRASRSGTDNLAEITDKEINGLDDLGPGEKVRGFVKSVAEHGIFVTLGRNVDARVQIKELYDDVCAF